MTAQTWRAHYAQKYQYSLRLFYCLISFLPRCRWSPPIYGSSFYAALRPDRRLQRAAAALALKWPQSKINIPTISLLFGMLWAWHVVTKAMLLTPPHFNYLVIALLSILFIGTIAFSNNITAFTLHSLPTFLACLIMAEGGTMVAYDLLLYAAYSRYYPAKYYPEAQRCLYAGFNG